MKPNQRPGARRRLRKPGPATSAETMPGAPASVSARAAAMSRGAIRAGRASTIAALVAMSPWAGSRGGSTVTAPRSSPCGSRPSAASRASPSSTRAFTSANRSITVPSDAAGVSTGSGRPPRGSARPAGPAARGRERPGPARPARARGGTRGGADHDDAGRVRGAGRGPDAPLHPPARRPTAPSSSSPAAAASGAMPTAPASRAAGGTTATRSASATRPTRRRSAGASCRGRAGWRPSSSRAVPAPASSSRWSARTRPPCPAPAPTSEASRPATTGRSLPMSS